MSRALITDKAVLVDQMKYLYTEEKVALSFGEYLDEYKFDEETAKAGTIVEASICGNWGVAKVELFDGEYIVCAIHGGGHPMIFDTANESPEEIADTIINKVNANHNIYIDIDYDEGV